MAITRSKKAAPRVLSLAARASRRRGLRAAASAFGVSMLVAAAGTTVTVALWRVLGAGGAGEMSGELGSAWLLIGAGWLAAAIGYTAVRTVVAMRSPHAALAELDRSLSLNDRLSTAFALTSSANRRASSEAAFTGAFEALAVADAEAIAGRVRPRQAIRVDLGRTWFAWPVLTAVAIGVGLYMPALDLLGTASQRELQIQAAERIREATRSIDELNDRIRDIESSVDLAHMSEGSGGDTADQPAVDVISEEDRRALERVSEDLASGGLSPDEARATAAEVTERAAERLRREADEAEAQAQRISESLRNAAGSLPSDTTSSSATDALREALESGDLGAAIDAADELAQELDTLDEAGRERLERNLEALAESLDRAAREAETEAQRLERELASELARRGLDPSTLDPSPQAAAPDDEAGVDPSYQPPTPEDLADQLRERGLDPQDADRAAQQLDRQRRERDAAESAESTSRSLRDMLRDFGKKPDPPASDTPPEQPQAETPTGDQPSSDGASLPDHEQATEAPTPDPPRQDAPEGPPQPASNDPGAEPRPGDQNRQSGTPRQEQPAPAGQQSDPPRQGQRGEQAQESQQSVPSQQQQSRERTESMPDEPGTSAQPESSPPVEQPSADREMRGEQDRGVQRQQESDTTEQAEPGQRTNQSGPQTADQPAGEPTNAVERDSEPSQQQSSEQRQADEQQPELDQQPVSPEQSGARGQSNEQGSGQTAPESRPDLGDTSRPPEPGQQHDEAQQPSGEQSQRGTEQGQPSSTDHPRGGTSSQDPNGTDPAGRSEQDVQTEEQQQSTEESGDQQSGNEGSGTQSSRQGAREATPVENEQQQDGTGSRQGRPGDPGEQGGTGHGGEQPRDTEGPSDGSMTGQRPGEQSGNREGAGAERGEQSGGRASDMQPDQQNALEGSARSPRTTEGQQDRATGTTGAGGSGTEERSDGTGGDNGPLRDSQDMSGRSDSPREQLERMRDRLRDAQRRRDAADQLTEANQRLLEDMSPERRAEIERLAEQLRRENPDRMSDQRFDRVDVRTGEGAGADGRRAGQVEGEGANPLRGTARSVSRDPASIAQDIARGRQEAERAFEDRRVPADRAAAIREYFEKQSRRIDRPSEAGGASDTGSVSDGGGGHSGGDG